jgi:hypothetical protein
MPTYYEREKETRKAYQRKYRADNIEEVRKKDKERKRRPKPPPVIVIEHNVKVSFM